MKHKKIIAVMTVAGLMAATASVGAQSLFEKVSGILNHEVSVVVNGEKTSIVPVYIDGKAYLPLRDAATGLGYEVSYDAGKNEIAITGNAEEEDEVEYIMGTGVIADIAEMEDGRFRIEFLGHGSNRWVILYADEETTIVDEAGKAVSAEDLKEGTQIVVEYGPVMALSFPGQSHAAKITVGAERLAKEDVVQSVERTDDGWQVKFGETKDGEVVTTLTLNAGKETAVMTAQGESVDWEDLKAGTKVRAYYGPIMTKSLPPQSPLFYLVVLGDEAPASGKMTPEAAQEYRDLAWALVAEQASDITTKPEEAIVSIVSAKDSGVLENSEEQKKLLADIQAANGNLVTVTYQTSQDELLGPLTVAFDFDTKAFVGFYARR
ncbi:stalk domain-containing protein [Paenibacillus antri]|nr:stalk domain-containing protein [Paenibacillus antri]